MQSFRIITPQTNAPFTIGRKPDNALVLDNPMVSRYHAVMEIEDGKWILRNLSQNSVTQVNGNDIDKRFLEDGDVITIGPLQLRATLKSYKLQLLLMETVERDLVQSKVLHADWDSIDDLHTNIPEGTFARQLDSSNGSVVQLKFKNALIDTHKKSTKVLELKDGKSVRLPSSLIAFSNGELTCKNLPQGFDVEVKNLDVFADKKQLLSGINFKLEAGEILAIIGRSGQGKSTLLRLLQGKHRAAAFKAALKLTASDRGNVHKAGHPPIQKHSCILSAQQLPTFLPDRRQILRRADNHGCAR